VRSGFELCLFCHKNIQQNDIFKLQLDTHFFKNEYDSAVSIHCMLANVSTSDVIHRTIFQPHLHTSADLPCFSNTNTVQLSAKQVQQQMLQLKKQKTFWNFPSVKRDNR
jgi:hypothetical protein